MDDRNPGRMSLIVFFMLLSVATIDGAILAHKNIDSSAKQVKRLSSNDARSFFNRQRRSASTTPSDRMLSNEVVLNGTENHTQAFVHWSGKLKSEAVFILTLQYKAEGVIDSQMWRSRDYGTTYHKLPLSKDAHISFFFVSPADHNKMVFTDIKNQCIYKSTNENATPINVSLPADVDDIRMHYENSDWMLLYDYYQRKVYVSMNFGDTWKLLQSDVNSRIFWGIKGYDDPRVVHMEIQPQDSEQAFYKRCTIPDCQADGDGIDYNLGPFMSQTMLIINEYIFVQKSNLDGTDSHMMVSYRRREFVHAYFPDNVQTKDFIVLDASEGQVFMAVNHGDRMGVSLYLSDATGRYYVLSLSSVHHRTASHWFDVDMHKVQGLNGTYLANQQLIGNGNQRKLKSLISFDKGGNWMEIPSPNNCVSDSCALLLRLDMASFFQDWILSEEKAPGFLIAHGHYGRNYEHELKNMSVFTSVDGGWTWEESPLRGVYHFNILDQGSIVTAIKTGDQDPTNSVQYSFDEGSTWQHDEFGSKQLIVDGVLNEPGINTVVASVYGHENSNAAWTMVKLNFSQVLSRKCDSNSDYVKWMVSDHDKTEAENCLLGQQVSYRRRKRSSRCFNGEQFVRQIDKKHCACEAEDFECDFGYRQQGDKCQKEGWFDNGYIARECIEGNKYNKSSGYRKVGSDKCTGGVENNSPYQPTPDVDCPLVAPSHMQLVANITVVATGRPVRFHISQKRGSVHSTEYVWNFNDTNSVSLTGLHAAQQQIHNFTKAGVYFVSVSAANNKGKNSSNPVTVTVEDAVHTVGVFKVWAAKVGYPVSVSVTTNVKQSKSGGNLHYLCRFGDEETGTKGKLVWDPQVTHTYNKSGVYTMAITAINGISAITKQVTINVIDDGIMVQLGFSPNVNQLFDRAIFYSERIFYLLESIRQELVLMLGINLDRLALSLNSTIPVRIDVLVLPPPANVPASEASTKQIVKTFIDLVGNKTFTLFRSAGLPRSLGDINVTSVIVLKGNKGGSGGGGGGGDDKKSGANYRAVYITVPIVLLAGVVTGLVLVYYRRRFRNIRRYSMVNQHEDTDALLDDEEDEPPLDLRADARDSNRNRDDSMLDLGSGSQLVMVTGGGGGDSAENC